MDDRCISYYSSINPLARKVIKDVEVLKYAIGSRWNDLEWGQQEDLIDDYMVDVTVRERMSGVEKLDTYPQSFPKLKVETGEKIIVDFENDCWTWQDEHSSPFNWRTKSQQDLTLDDLEPEVLSTPPNKTKKKESESPSTTDQVTPAPREFSVQTAGSIWESPFLQGMKKPDFINRSSRSRSVSPSKSATSKESLHSRSRTPEEVNYAFTGSVDDLSSSQSSQRSPSLSSGEILSTSPAKENSKQKSSPRGTSSSPIKNILSKEKHDTHGSQSLVSRKDNEDHAFDNPALSNEWSSFVNESTTDEDPPSNTPSPYKKLLKEPEPVDMDRGDHSGLLTDMRDDSVLSGEEKDGAGYHEEVLVVETEEAVDTDTQNTSSLFKTGFDFLDNW